jgi:hypothetical protein
LPQGRRPAVGASASRRRCALAASGPRSAGRRRAACLSQARWPSRAPGRGRCSPITEPRRCLCGLSTTVMARDRIVPPLRPPNWRTSWRTGRRSSREPAGVRNDVSPPCGRGGGSHLFGVSRGCWVGDSGVQWRAVGGRRRTDGLFTEPMSGICGETVGRGAWPRAGERGGAPCFSVATPRAWTTRAG